MMRNLIALSVITAFTTTSAMAEQEPSYNFIEGGYVKLNLGDSSDISLGGVEVRGNIELNDHFYFDTKYISVSATQETYAGKIDYDLNELRLGIGYKTNLMPGTSLFTHLNYIDSELKTKAGFSAPRTTMDMS